MGRKADAETICPLCHDCHAKYDQHRHPFDWQGPREKIAALAPHYAALWTQQRQEAA